MRRLSWPAPYPASCPCREGLQVQPWHLGVGYGPPERQLGPPATAATSTRTAATAATSTRTAAIWVTAGSAGAPA